MTINVQATGSFVSTQKLLYKMSKTDISALLESYGPLGVQALTDATPIKTGETAHSWTYKVTHEEGVIELVWMNTHVVNGANIAILLQYGHGTKNGGYVHGRDYINPAMKPVFDKILADIRRVVNSK